MKIIYILRGHLVIVTFIFLIAIVHGMGFIGAADAQTSAGDSKAKDLNMDLTGAADAQPSVKDSKEAGSDNEQDKKTQENNKFLKTLGLKTLGIEQKVENADTNISKPLSLSDLEKLTPSTATKIREDERRAISKSSNDSLINTKNQIRLDEYYRNFDSGAVLVAPPP